MSRYEPSPERAEEKWGEDQEIDLLLVLSTIWKSKWLILAVTFMFALGAIAYALSKPDIYQASVLLAPANDEDEISGRLGGLANLAGINMGRSRSNQTTIAKEVLRSRSFLADFINRHQLGPQVFAVEAWDPNEAEWQYNRELYSPESGRWQRGADGKSVEPTSWDLVKRFNEFHLRISENKETGLITLSVRNFSPSAAKNWTQWLVEDINAHMRQKDVVGATAKIRYLENKLENTRNAGMQQVFYQLIETETRTVMLANAQPEYVFRTLDPAFVPEERAEPNRLAIVLVAIFLGGFLALFLVFSREFVLAAKGKYKATPQPLR